MDRYTTENKFSRCTNSPTETCKKVYFTLLARLRFRWLMLEGRFAEALAVVDRRNVATADEQAIALHRLGCYRSVTALDFEPLSTPAVVAVAASLAACAKPHDAAALLHDARARGAVGGRSLQAAVRAVAPFHVGLAAELAADLAGSPGLKAAVLAATGRHDEARGIVEHAIQRNSAPRDHDLLLLASNFVAEPAERTRLLNAHLAAHGLTPARVNSEFDILNPMTARSTVPPATVTGPLVSVIMPAYNAEERIGPAIASLLRQTYRDLEIIVVDDASTDDTVAVAQNAAAGDRRMRVLRLQQNGGPYVARNCALATANGVFVTCHDSDDWAHPERIARQVLPLLRFPWLICTTSNWVRSTDEGLFYARPVYPLCRLNPASPLFRREAVVARMGGWETVRTGADSEFLARLKLAFGPLSWRRVRRTLTLGAHRPGSLMTDPMTGMDTGAINRERLDYWETWSARHRRILHATGPDRFAIGAHT